MACYLLISAVKVYLFKDYFGSATALSLVGLIQTVIVFIAMPLVKLLVARFGKKELTAAGLLLSAAVYGLLYFIPDLGVYQFIGNMAVSQIGYAFFNLMIWACVTDVIDYHEYLTGLREDGTVYSVYSFARKVGQAIAADSVVLR